jgi:hypothetical protein
MHIARVATAVAFVLAFVFYTMAEAQTLTTLYTFQGNSDGSMPIGPLVFDTSGNLYGTTYAGGVKGSPCFIFGCGTVFELTPSVGGKWTELQLYQFTGRSDGYAPEACVTLDSAGDVFGTSPNGGSFNGLGTIFKLTHSAQDWKFTRIFAFNGGDGADPLAGLTLEKGNLYGAAFRGGIGFGNVYELSPSNSTLWNETVLYDFTNGSASLGPDANVIFDADGNLYGTTRYGGGKHFGAAFEMTPSPDGSWTYKTLHVFTGLEDGGLPMSLVLDAVGNLYGITVLGGSYNAGTAFELIRGSNWTEAVLHSFGSGQDGLYPMGSLAFDPLGNLYGTTEYGGSVGPCVAVNVTVGCGTIFRLNSTSSGTWNEDILYRFSGGADGGLPDSAPILDSLGSLYGTTSIGGNLACPGEFEGCGTIYQLTP